MSRNFVFIDSPVSGIIHKNKVKRFECIASLGGAATLHLRFRYNQRSIFRKMAGQACHDRLLQSI